MWCLCDEIEVLMCNTFFSESVVVMCGANYFHIFLALISLDLFIMMNFTYSWAWLSHIFCQNDVSQITSTIFKQLKWNHICNNSEVNMCNTRFVFLRQMPWKLLTPQSLGKIVVTILAPTCPKNMKSMSFTTPPCHHTHTHTHTPSSNCWKL